ncbi:conserved hypothetical protein [Vibrio phage 193E37-1]|nr:conserved hypothetical protein [Vibrio phage 193E37-1]
MSNNYTTSFVAGLLIRKQVRQYLDSLIFQGEAITYHENKGWVDSSFTLKGDRITVISVLKLLHSTYN